MWIVPIYHTEMFREFISKKESSENRVVTPKCKLWTKGMTDITTNYSGEDGIKGGTFWEEPIWALGI